jgi:hypothetical protein
MGCPFHQTNPVPVKILFQSQLFFRRINAVHIHVIKGKRSFIFFDNGKGRAVHRPRIPSAFAIPWANVVLPAPKSPSSAMTSPGFKYRAMVRANAFVSSSLNVSTVHSFSTNITCLQNDCNRISPLSTAFYPLFFQHRVPRIPPGRWQRFSNFFSLPPIQKLPSAGTERFPTIENPLLRSIPTDTDLARNFPHKKAKPETKGFCLLQSQS